MNQIHVIAHTHWDQEWYFTRQDSMVLASYNFADVIDTLERGLLVTRHEGGGRALPPLRAMHWAKALFEKRYLRRYR